MLHADNDISGVNQVFHLTQSVFSLAVFVEENLLRHYIKIVQD